MTLENYSLMGKPNKEGSGRGTRAVSRGEKIDKETDTSGSSKEGDLNIKGGRGALRNLMKLLNIFLQNYSSLSSCP